MRQEEIDRIEPLYLRYAELEDSKDQHLVGAKKIEDVSTKSDDDDPLDIVDGVTGRGRPANGSL